MIPTIVIAAPGSGAGKTTVTIAIMAALRRRNLKVAPFKVGPDYIDPQFHRRVCGRPSYNLDSFLTGTDGVLRSFARGAAGADIAIVEGVMGLFDGSSPESIEGSTAEIARILGAPIVLVIDAAGMAGSVAALVRGFARFEPDVRVDAVILNRLSGPSHYEYLQPCILRERVAALGYFPRSADFAFPERKLGLLPVDETDVVGAVVDKLADAAEERIDLDALIRLAAPASLSPDASAPGAPVPVASPPIAAPAVVRIAWAQDRAFHFSYQENKDILREAGVEIVEFSPLENSRLPDDIDGVWIGGGFPERFAAPLSANESMKESLRSFAGSGRPVYGECGGFMYLCEELIDESGNRWRMAGLLPGATKMTSRLKRFGYARAVTNRETIFGPAGATLLGHGFHYSDHIQGADPNDHAYRVTSNRRGDSWDDGSTKGSVLGAYMHVHLGGDPAPALRLVEALRRSR